MDRTVIKLRVKEDPSGRGEHHRVTVFTGFEYQTLRNAGTLILDTGEVQMLLTALRLAVRATTMSDHLLVLHEGYLSEEWARERNASLVAAAEEE